MASETKEIARAIDKLTSEMRKGFAQIEKAINQKQFNDLMSPPPIGTVYHNNRGCVLMNKVDFGLMIEECHKEGEEEEG